MTLMLDASYTTLAFFILVDNRLNTRRRRTAFPEIRHDSIGNARHWPQRDV